MSLNEETLKTLRGSHLLSLVVAATALIVLFAPFEVDFREAIKEAALLKSMETAEFERYVGGMVGSPEVLPDSGLSTGRGAAGDIILFMQGEKVCCISEHFSPNWDVTPALKYSTPPTNGSLEEWSRWMSSKAPAEFWTPDWSNAVVSLDTRLEERPNDQQYRVLLFFAMQPANASVFSVRPEHSVSLPTSEYRFLAFFEDSILGSKEIKIWWPEVIAMNDSQLWDPGWRRTIDKAGRSVVVGRVKSNVTKSVTSSPTGAGSINVWLRTHPRLKNLFELNSDGSPLPRLHGHWSSLANKSLSEAASFMERQQRALKDVAILGVTVPGQLCVVAVPLAFIVCFGYLYLHLRVAVAVVISQRGVPPISFPWIGIYDDRLSAAITSLSLTVVPLLLISGILCRYGSRVGIASVVSGAILGAIAVSAGVLADRKTSALRSALFEPVPPTTREIST